MDLSNTESGAARHKGTRPCSIVRPFVVVALVMPRAPTSGGQARLPRALLHTTQSSLGPSLKAAIRRYHHLQCTVPERRQPCPIRQKGTTQTYRRRTTTTHPHRPYTTIRLALLAICASAHLHLSPGLGCVRASSYLPYRWQ